MAVADADGDVAMADAAAEVAKGADEGGEGEAAAAAAVAAAADPGPAPEERLALAEAAKEAGNSLLKAGDVAAAVARYQEGLSLAKPLLEQGDEGLGEDVRRRGAAVHTALCLNVAQACIKQADWMSAIDHAEQVLLLDKDNAKALYRRGLACAQVDTEGRLEQARADFARVAQLDPGNREVREQLQRVKERLKDLRQREKERLSAAMKGGLYQDQHDRLGRQQAAYEEEVERRKDAGEEAISFEDWIKKEREKEEEHKKKQKEELQRQREEEHKKKQKEELQRQREEARREEETKRLEEENARRASEGLAPLSPEEWQAQQRAPARDDVVRTDESDLDEEERKLLQEAKSKGYYHGRLGTVLSDAAPRPQQVSADQLPPPVEGSGHAGSEWNQAGTWEEKDCTAWAKERLAALLQAAAAQEPEVALPSGAPAAASAKVTKVKSLTGEAQLVMVRKQPRHGYNFEADLSFNISFTGIGEGAEKESLSGVLHLPELMDTVAPQDLKMDGTWKGAGPSEPLRPLAEAWVDRLRESVRAQVRAFREEYQARR